MVNTLQTREPPSGHKNCSKTWLFQFLMQTGMLQKLDSSDFYNATWRVAFGIGRVKFCNNSIKCNTSGCIVKWEESILQPIMATVILLAVSHVLGHPVLATVLTPRRRYLRYFLVPGFKPKSFLSVNEILSLICWHYCSQLKPKISSGLPCTKRPLTSWRWPRDAWIRRCASLPPWWGKENQLDNIIF